MMHVKRLLAANQVNYVGLAGAEADGGVVGANEEEEEGEEGRRVFL